MRRLAIITALPVTLATAGIQLPLAVTWRNVVPFASFAFFA